MKNAPTSNPPTSKFLHIEGVTKEASARHAKAVRTEVLAALGTDGRPEIAPGVRKAMGPARAAETAMRNPERFMDVPDPEKFWTLVMAACADKLAVNRALVVAEKCRQYDAMAACAARACELCPAEEREIFEYFKANQARAELGRKRYARAAAYAQEAMATAKPGSKNRQEAFAALRAAIVAGGRDIPEGVRTSAVQALLRENPFDWRTRLASTAAKIAKAVGAAAI